MRFGKGSYFLNNCTVANIPSHADLCHANAMDDDEDVPTCPLCLEELDATDRAVKACQCGYQVCLWCLHHIREQLNGKCPACRTPYEETNFKYSEVNPEMAAKEAKERATAKKERERKEKLREIERERARAMEVSQQKAKTNLKHVRIVQRSLVYVIGLSLTLAREEVLRRSDMFGKFGRLARILVNRAHPYNADAPGGPSISAYIQYVRDCDAAIAARTMNNAVFDGREIRCAIATTKYCDTLVKSGITDVGVSQHCGNPDCMYYHELCQKDDVLTREEVLALQLGPPPPAHLFHAEHRRSAVQLSRTTSHISGRPAQGPAANGSNTKPGSLPSASVPIRRPSPNGPGQARKSPPESPENIRKPNILTPPRNAPSYSPPLASSPQLPSTAGWASSQQQPPRTVGSAPTRSSTSSDVYTASRAKASSALPHRGRLGPLPSRSTTVQSADRAPPGFEESKAQDPLPTRPPGFSEPLHRAYGSRLQWSQSRSSGAVGSASLSISPPPGFGHNPMNTSETHQERESPVSSMPSASAVAAAWSQDACSDKVFSTSDRVGAGGKVQNVVGSSLDADRPDPKGDLADVLARIGGNLGVSSEFQSVPKRTYNGHVGVKQSKENEKTTNVQGLASIFSSRTLSEPVKQQQFDFAGRSSSELANLNLSNPNALHSTAQDSAYLRGSFLNVRGNPSDLKLSRRNNSRFGFAREDNPAPASTGASNQALPTAFVIPDMPTVQRGKTSHDEKRSHADMQGVSFHPALRAHQQSRFEFTERDPVTQKVPQGSNSQLTEKLGLEKEIKHGFKPVSPHAVSNTPSRTEPLVSSFEQLSTAEKLASIFNHAQWSTEALPPMPVIDSRNVLSAAKVGSEAVSTKQGTAEPQLRSLSGDSRAEISGSEVASSIALGASSLPSMPPGFREATSGNRPEAAVDDASRSTTTDVAAAADSGGYDSSSVNGEDCVSSGVESIEEDRKRSRAQRKRDKKARQKREAAERRTAYVPPAQPPVPPASAHQEEFPSDHKDVPFSEPQNLQTTVQKSMSTDAVQDRREMVVSLADTQMQPSTQSAAEDPGRFMSVSELEREVEAARAREAQLQSRLLELQRRIRSYDNVRI